MNLRARLPIALLAGGLALLVYELTLAPSLTWAHWGGDGGDFITAAVTGRMPHPPGFPLYLALARLWVLLPLRNPAWRLNLLSALMAAGAVTLTAFALQRREKSPWIVLAASLTLAFAPLFWSQALITEVYTTATFFVALANCELRITNYEPPIPNPQSLIFNGLLCGLGMSVHPTLVFLMPLWIIHLPRDHKESIISDSQLHLPVYCLPSTVYRLLLFFTGLGIGLLPYALLPLFGSWPQPWGDLRTIAGWWDVVRARLYWGYAFGLPWAEWPARLWMWARLLIGQFSPVGGALVLLGVWLQQRSCRREILGLAAAGGLLALFALGYTPPDAILYLLPLLPFFIPWLAVGLRWLVHKGLPAWATLALPLSLLVWNWQSLDLRRDAEAVLWYNRVLDAAPADAVLLTQNGAHTFALWYAQEAAGLRQDVLVIDRNLWNQESYRQFLYRQMGRAGVAPEDLAASRPVCYVEEGITCP